MKYEELLGLKKEVDKIRESEKATLEGIGTSLKDFLKGFNVEVTSFGFTFDQAGPKSTRYAIHPEAEGLLTDFALRVAPHTEDEKKFGVILVGLLDAGEKKYVRGKVISKGNKDLEDETMLSRLIEYFQGELGVFDAEVLQ